MVVLCSAQMAQAATDTTWNGGTGGDKSSPKSLTALTLSLYVLIHVNYKTNCEQVLPKSLKKEI